MSDRVFANAEFAAGGLRLQVAGPPADLSPYISAYYRTEVAPGTVVEDWLPPEEANLRCGKAEVYDASIGDAALARAPACVLSGPTDRVTRLRIGGGRFWGIGLTPAGWARFVGQPAASMANRFECAESALAEESLGDLLKTLCHEVDRMEEAADLIAATFRSLAGDPLAEVKAIRDVHLAVTSTDVHTVTELAEIARMQSRTFVRFCRRHFGFAPSTLLRRQRFLRSLGKYMLDPSMNWISSLDTHYWDQAQFIRDFRSVMGMTPGEYAALPHPIVHAAVAVTNAGSGVAMQALYNPDRERESETGL
ncbi:helix-turn-helix domain-containing protein [Qipengyuania gaetbuli]|uniref:helix-turn-helix domain-containing protein n=1 Tax=Qipengyuania gaetbuli TaxID=266952 RepID=UPI001CD5E571|nr:helix-turn-helix domain-containing protein [Qipengyuania gaetbuli]MCA0910288.1 helix-turn-helix domain-containing protein [Qipengyuania gaetbuli]